MKIKFVDGSQIAKVCPKCKDDGRGEVKLIIKTSRSGNQFIACPNWPNCDHSESIPEEMYMRANNQPTLF